MTDSQARLAQALTGRYRLDAELGRGGMATVYRAHDRAVALRVLHAELARSLDRWRLHTWPTMQRSCDQVAEQIAKHVGVD